MGPHDYLVQFGHWSKGGWEYAFPIKACTVREAAEQFVAGRHQSLGYPGHVRVSVRHKDGGGAEFVTVSAIANDYRFHANVDN